MATVTVNHPETNTLEQLKTIYSMIWDSLSGEHGYSTLRYVYERIYEGLCGLVSDIQYRNFMVARGFYESWFDTIASNIDCQIDDEEAFTSQQAKVLKKELKNNLEHVFTHTYGRKLTLEIES